MILLVIKQFVAHKLLYITEVVQKIIIIPKLHFNINLVLNISMSLKEQHFLRSIEGSTLSQPPQYIIVHTTERRKIQKIKYNIPNC